MTKQEKFELIQHLIEQTGYQCQEVRCLSHLHQGHAHYSDNGSHFEAIISVDVSSGFEKLKIQKAIMKNFISYIPQEIHSLILTFSACSEK